MSDELKHYGTLGMKWGIRKDKFNSPENLLTWMKNNIRYSEFTKLKSASEVMATKSGSCHDQVMLEYAELGKMGLKPKAEFLMEYTPGNSVGGMTHSFVHYEKAGKTYWIENAMGGQEGVHEFDDISDIKTKITNLHTSGKIGDSKQFSQLLWSPFYPNEHTPGESLSDLVNITLNNIQHGDDELGNDELKHYGVPRRSGRYPWGSGQDPYQRAISFRGHIDELKTRGLSDVEIARYEGISTTQLRARMSLAKDEEREGDRMEALRLKDKGYSNMEIVRRMGKNESSVRNLLDPILAERASATRTTANVLKDSVDQKRYVDIGAGVANTLGVSPTRLGNAVALLKEQGYKTHQVNVEQLGMPGKFTIMKVLGAPNTDWKELVNDISLIQSVTANSDDYGRTFNTNLGLKPIEHVNPNRVKVRYAEEGGRDKDGVMEIRRGLKDLDLGNSKYAQVRIGVGGTHYLKGMAIYNDHLPDGVDILFNTNKSKDVPMMGEKDNTVLKKLKSDPDNPFGATIKRQNGAINIVNEEGDWDKWSKTISSQVLSKQTVPLAKKQLGLALSEKQEAFDEIMSLTNPVVKKQLLLEFADEADSAAVHLKAAALPRQASKVLLPIPDLKETEVYAPSFNNGERLVLIRHPHGGRFEIPELVVNNKSKAARSVMDNAIDAVGINPKVAQKLSGADFDGDSVLAIPNNLGSIKTASSLKSLENFDPMDYKLPEGAPKVASKNGKWPAKQQQMGSISNLITDMTIKGAPLDEIARAVKHSMVVIDAEKHNLNYKQSEIDNGISELKARYQNSARGGASTLISKASSEDRPYEKKLRSSAEGGPIDPITGKKVYVETGASYTNRNGKIIKKTTRSTKMAETDDAFSLSSGTPIEETYAKHANSLKALGNLARKSALSIVPTPYSPSAKMAYSKEVDSLNSKLNIAIMNKPIERQAQVLANSTVKRIQQANPDMDYDDLKKVRNQALAEARTRTGAKKAQVDITDREWEAIQAGAVSPSKLTQILLNSDSTRVKELATPHANRSIPPERLARAKTLLKSGNTLAEVSEALGVSVSTLTKSLKQ
jgi:hypothetical protein